MRPVIVRHVADEPAICGRPTKIRRDGWKREQVRWAAAEASQLLSQEWESRRAGLEQEPVNSGFFVSLELPACRHLQIGPRSCQTSLVCWVRGSVFAGRLPHLAHQPTSGTAR